MTKGKKKRSNKSKSKPDSSHHSDHEDDLDNKNINMMTTKFTAFQLNHLFSETALLKDGVEISSISEEDYVAQLWAGYGGIHSFQIILDDDAKTEVQLVVKRVNPPAADTRHPSVSHLRKIRSYQIEANFYTNIAPLIQPPFSCTVPTPYSILSADDSSSFQFILSDLNTNYKPSYGQLSKQHTLDALSWLANFHAFFHQHEIIINNVDHDDDDDNDDNQNHARVWQSGGYWHLDTRLEELQAVESSNYNRWSCFHPSNSNLASIINQRMKESHNTSFTLVHGDFKKDNIFFSSMKSPGRPSRQDQTLLSPCAVVDFQYCGCGYGMKDVVMLIVSSVSNRIFDRSGGGDDENELLSFYYQEFRKQYLNKQRPETQRPQQQQDFGQFQHQEKGLTFDSFRKQYELCLLDYVRFMAGWGFWGSNVNYAESRAWSIIESLVTSVKGNSKSKHNNFRVDDVLQMTNDDWVQAIYQRYPLSEF